MERSEGHISFNNGNEYFWAVNDKGSRVVLKAALSNPIDQTTKQRIGARFEGTEAWFQSFGGSLLPPPVDVSSK